MSRKIALITGTRAEYGLLSGLAQELITQGADAQFIVTGAHLSAAHGMTVQQIEAEGLPIAARVDMHLHSDTPVALAQATGLALSGIAAALDALKPHIVVILGDRYEMLAAATAATLLHLPIAHLHGGECTEGAMDESIRHAITKLSYWHFAAAPAYAARIIQLGETPEHVYTSGALGIDHLTRYPALTIADLERELGMTWRKPVALFTYHPETLSDVPVQTQIDNVLAAIAQRPDITWLMTGANADAGGQHINAALQSFAARHEHVYFHMSLGARRYASAMREAQLVVGNSSSALLEAPALAKPAVNIGDRQKGRMRSPHIVDCRCETPAILKAIDHALAMPALPPSNLFGTPGTVTPHIARQLMSVKIPATLRKTFHDIA
jgi:UDP-hydrolysing UDP-N-acetyl-D-glucosamine 2-epimerase